MSREQVTEVRNEIREQILLGTIYQDSEGRNWPKGHKEFKDLNESVQAVVQRLDKLLENNDSLVAETIRSLGPSDFASDLKNDSERLGALKLLFWIECILAH